MSGRLHGGGHRDLWLFLLLSAVWGAAFVAIKAGLAYFPPVLFAAFRFDVAGLVMLGYALATTARWRPQGWAEWRVVASSGLFIIAGYHALVFVGELTTTSAAAAVIVGLNPVLTTAFARALLPGDRLGPIGVLGVLLGLAGVVVMAGPGALAVLTGGSVGELLVLGAVTSFAFGSVLTRRSAHDLPVVTMQAWSMLAGAVVLHAASPVIGESMAAVEWSVGAVAALAYLAIAASALGFLLYFALLDRLGPVEINLVSYVVPVFAAIVGWLLLGEGVDAGMLLGFLLIVASFAVIKRRSLADELGKLRS